MISSFSQVSAADENEVVTCDLDGELSLLHLRHGVYYGLDVVGTRIWKMLAQPRLVSEVRDQLVRDFAVEPARCEADLKAVLEKMASVGLIRVHETTDEASSGA